MIACKNCIYYQESKCTHPERDDRKSIHYYGYIKETSYCAEFTQKEVDEHA